MKVPCALVVLLAVTLHSHLSHCDSHGSGNMERPIVIGHRGACGIYPEHTIPSFQAAIDQGADAVECDVTVTKDLQLICIHQAWIKTLTDVEEKFPDIARDDYIPEWGYNLTDEYFTTDLTLEELKTLRVKEPLEFRDQSYNWEYEIPTFEEYLDLVGNASRPVAIYPEIKEPGWTNALSILQDANTTMEELVVAALQMKGYTQLDDLCYLQCFSHPAIMALTEITNVKLIYLSHDPIDNDQLDSIKDVCYGIGVWKDTILPENFTTHYLMDETDLVARAHDRGLKVHTYTMRNEDQYLAFDYMQDPYEEYDRLTKTGVDGMFTDFPATMVRFQNTMERHVCKEPTPSTAQHNGASVLSICMVLAFVFLCK